MENHKHQLLWRSLIDFYETECWFMPDSLYKSVEDFIKELSSHFKVCICEWCGMWETQTLCYCKEQDS